MGVGVVLVAAVVVLTVPSRCSKQLTLHCKKIIHNLMMVFMINDIDMIKKNNNNHGKFFY